MRISLLVTLSVLILGMAAPAYALSPVACTMDAKLCPDGVTYVGRDGDRNCQWQLCPGEIDMCKPYQCNDGTRIDRCAADGTVINYFAAPCLTHGGEVDSSQSFSDVPATHPNAEAIAYVRTQGIVRGYPDGTFKPDSVINRAEFVKIFVESIFVDTGKMCKQIPFSDVSGMEWYGQYIYTARCNGIIDGYSDGTFRPAATINFVEAAKILSRAFGTLDTTESQTSLWYEAYVQDLVQRSAIPLSIARFDQQITRGEMAEMIYRLKTGTVDKPSNDYDLIGGGLK